MAKVSCDHVSAYPGYQWLTPGAVVEMSDDEAAELLEIAGPHGGYTVLKPAPKATRAPKAATTGTADAGES